MKTWISYFAAMMLLMNFASANDSDHQLEGIWESENNQITLIIESTNNGIRVKRKGQNRWYEYHQYRPNQFTDSEGNIYFLMRDRILEWEDHRGRKRLRFRKIGSERYAEKSDQHDNWREDTYDRSSRWRQDSNISGHHNTGKSSRKIVSARHLNGRWINQTTGQTIFIKARNNRLRVKAHRGGWENFERRDGNTFVDHRGNRYVLNQKRLVYTSRRRDFRMDFVRH